MHVKTITVCRKILYPIRRCYLLFEDIIGGGDRDYEDLVVNFSPIDDSGFITESPSAAPVPEPSTVDRIACTCRHWAQKKPPLKKSCFTPKTGNLHIKVARFFIRRFPIFLLVMRISFSSFKNSIALFPCDL